MGVQLSTQGAIGEVTAAVGRQLEEELQLRDAFKLYWADAEGELTLVGKTTQMRDLVDASELVARLAEGALRSAPLLPLKGPPGALAVLDDDDDDDAEAEEAAGCCSRRRRRRRRRRPRAAPARARQPTPTAAEAGAGGSSRKPANGEAAAAREKRRGTEKRRRSSGTTDGRSKVLYGTTADRTRIARLSTESAAAGSGTRRLRGHRASFTRSFTARRRCASPAGAAATARRALRATIGHRERR